MAGRGLSVKPSALRNAKQEVDKWVEKAVYDVRFRTDTKANLFRLDEIMKQSLSKFVTISATGEAVVYKIIRYWVENGMITADDVTILEGSIILSAMDGVSLEWKQKERLDNLFDTMAADIRGHWVVIPDLDAEVPLSMAIYLRSKLIIGGAQGLVIFSEGTGSYAQVMVQQMHDPMLFQFPKTVWQDRRKRLEEDEW